MQDSKGRFIDEPEVREQVWKTAPRAEDKYGNTLVKIGKFWYSNDFNRFWQMVKEDFEQDEYVIVARVQDGRVFSKQRRAIINNHKWWKRRLESGWYVFFDHTIQQVY